MIKQMFVNRVDELSTLKQAYNSDRAEFIIIYGRRRVGKTELIKKSIENKNALYFFVEEALEADNLSSFKSKVAQLLGNPLIEKAQLSWEEVFDEVVKIDDAVIIFDEFPNLIKENKAIMSKFQKIWDELLCKTRIKLVMCGSSISMMENYLLGYKSPLYGRRTGQMFLQPMKFFHIKKFIDLPFEDIIKIYGITDGIPYYILEACYRLKNGEKLGEIFLPGKLLFEEAEVLIKYELRDPTRYYRILKAISLGYTKFGEITKYTEFNPSLISQYLDNLINLHIIEESFPVSEKKEKVRNRRYNFSDNYFNFYFRFIYPNKSELFEKRSISNFDYKYNQYLGFIFEKACREFLCEKSRLLPFRANKMGRWWNKETEIDLVFMDDERKQVLFTECKWKSLSEKQARAILDGLKEKSRCFEWNAGKRKEYFCLIAKKIENKANVKKEGYLVFDLDDF